MDESSHVTPESINLIQEEIFTLKEEKYSEMKVKAESRFISKSVFLLSFSILPRNLINPFETSDIVILCPFVIKDHVIGLVEQVLEEISGFYCVFITVFV